MLVLQDLAGAFAAGGIEQGFELIKRRLRRGLFLWKAVRAVFKS